MLRTMLFIHINRVYYEWLQTDERKMSQNVLEDLLDTIAITSDQLPYLSFSNNLHCMYKWKIQNTTRFSFW